MLPQGYADELWSLTPYSSMFFLVGGIAAPRWKMYSLKMGTIFFYFTFTSFTLCDRLCASYFQKIT